MKILVINGPNLNFLGIREKSIYGNQDYAYLLKMLEDKGKESGHQVETFQSNYEGGIIDRLQEAYFDGTDAIVINPGAYTHYSYAIHDAIKSVNIKTIEVHLSNIHAREEFRHKSYISLYAEKVIAGKGFDGYKEALKYFIDKGAC